MSFRYGSAVSRRGALESLRRYTRVTLLSTMPMVGGIPLLFAWQAGAPARPLLVVLAGVVLLLVVHWRRVERAIADPAGVLPWRRPAAGLLVATALMVYAILATGDPTNALWAFLPSMFVAELQYGRPTAQAWWLGILCAAGIGLVAAGAAAIVSDEPTNLAAATLAGAFVTLGLPLAELLALRQWRLALELEQLRRDAAELGATRERLRLAEDLHDILGHALEVVSLKSELATRLGPVDPERAHAEMAEVQRLARGALKDVRELAQGRRETDLDTELSGARGLLESAGIDCVVDLRAPVPPESELLGRVLREAVTNLLRHADTRRCWVTLRADDGRRSLSVVNDGVVATPAAGGDGTGLASLARRVTEAGGTFTAGPGERRGTFAVEAVLPS